MKKGFKWGLWGILILAVIGYSISVAVKPLEAELLEIKPQTIAKTFTGEGTVVPLNERVIYSPQGGKIVALPVAEGRKVGKGELLLRLDTRELDYQLRQLRGQLTSLKGQERQAIREPYQSQVAAQELAVEEARQEWERAHKELERVRILYEAGAASQKDLEDAERAVQQQENLFRQQEEALKLISEQQKTPQGTREQFAGSREALRAQMALLEYQKSRSVVTAPMEGLVKEVEVREGMVIAPGSPVLTLFEDGRYQVETYLLTGEVTLVQPGMKVRVIQENQAGDIAYDGTVSRISPAAEEKISALGLVEKRVKVTISLEGEVRNLGPGYQVDVVFTTHREKNRLVVPKTVLFPYGKGDALWVVRDGKVHVQPVKTGFETDEDVVITEGLKAGDRVIRNPQLEGLKEGKKVEANY